MPFPFATEPLLVVIDPHSCDSATSDSESESSPSESDVDVSVEAQTPEDPTKLSVGTDQRQQFTQKLLELERMRVAERRLCDQLNRVYAERARLILLLNIIKAKNSRKRIQ